MTTQITHVCPAPSCGRTFEADPRAVSCSGACRTRLYRTRAAGRAARRDQAFELLLAHGAEIRSAIAEARSPRRKLLDDLARQMDAVVSASLGPSRIA